MLLASTHNVMVVYISEQCFAFECYTDQVARTDCRIPTTTGQAKWTRINLNCTEDSTVQMFMRDTGHHFGRLDFLRTQKLSASWNTIPAGSMHCWTPMAGKVCCRPSLPKS
jgi:hypothetical protein